MIQKSSTITGNDSVVYVLSLNLGKSKGMCNLSHTQVYLDWIEYTPGEIY